MGQVGTCKKLVGELISFILPMLLPLSPLLSLSLSSLPISSYPSISSVTLSFCFCSTTTTSSPGCLVENFPPKHTPMVALTLLTPTMALVTSSATSWFGDLMRTRGNPSPSLFLTSHCRLREGRDPPISNVAPAPATVTAEPLCTCLPTPPPPTPILESPMWLHASVAEPAAPEAPLPSQFLGLHDRNPNTENCLWASCDSQSCSQLKLESLVQFPT